MVCLARNDKSMNLQQSLPTPAPSRPATWRCVVRAMVRHRHATSRRRGGTISGRLTRILALPVLAVLVLLSIVAVGDLSQYQTSQATRTSVSLALSTQELVQVLQEERGLASGLLGGDVGFRPDLPPSRAKVDAQLARLAAQARVSVTGADGVRAALAQMDGLDAVRAKVDAREMSRDEAFTYFTGRINALSSVDFGLSRSDDPALRREAAALGALSELKEYSAQGRAFLSGVFSAGGFHPGEYAQYALIAANGTSAWQRTLSFCGPAQRLLAMQAMNSGAASETLYFEGVALNAADGRLIQVDPQSWWSALTTVLDDMWGLQQSFGADIRQQAQMLENGATRRLGLLLGMVLVCLVGAVVLMVVAARSITGPLAGLAAEADALASQRLPDAVSRAQSAAEDEQASPPVPVRVPTRASAEIHSVAEALDRVQATAYTLATEQAMLRRTTTDSLANLGRRNQNLLRRQIGFITKLEQEETDPSGLANLFELDHLATRMRRNAESLLVLVGEASPRRWSAPLPIADVIRAAVSEVEEYRRVSLRRIDDAHVAGGHVTGVAHMLAELLENGLAFSPPDQDVEIQGRHLGSRYLIAITDQGVGMDSDDMARANARLRGEENFLMAPAKFLGHYVVGHLARQMSVEVQLGPSPVTGVTARVVLPASVLAIPAALDCADGGFVTVEAPPVIEEVVPPVAGSRVVPRAPQPVASHLAIGRRRPAVVEYITVPEVGRPVTVPMPAPPPPPVPPDPIARAHRTRNGLAKRPPRSQARQGTAAERAEWTAPEGPRPAVLDESPDQMRERLMSLRAGVRRGENKWGGNGSAAAAQGTGDNTPRVESGD